jgi:hypothetical protein
VFTGNETSSPQGGETSGDYEGTLRHHSLHDSTPYFPSTYYYGGFGGRQLGGSGR